MSQFQRPRSLPKLQRNSFAMRSQITLVKGLFHCLAVSVSQLECQWDVQLELPLGLEDENRRPGTKGGMARWTADRAIDKIRDRFGWDAIGYGSAVLSISRSVPDEFRKLAEKNL